MHAGDFKPEKLAEVIPFCQSVSRIKSDQGYSLAESQHFKKMFFLPMPGLMGQDGYYLIISVVGQQGIKKDNSFHVADTCEIGIAPAATAPASKSVPDTAGKKNQVTEDGYEIVETPFGPFKRRIK